MRRTMILAVFMTLLMCSTAFAQREEIMLSTYYPAPFGEYEELTANTMRAKKLVVGENWADSFTFPTPHSDSHPDLLVERRVGIGMQTPDMSLEVRTPSLWSGPAIGGSVDANNWAYLHVSAGDHALIWDDNGSAMRFGIDNKGAAGSWQERMRITGDGNVGIGTTSPDSALSIAGSNYLTLGEGTNTNPQCGIRFVAGDAEEHYRFWYDGTSGGGLQNRLQLTYMPTNTPLWVIYDGNVGIGTNAPAYKLDVRNGKINAGGGFVIHKVASQAAEDTMSKEEGQMWLRTDVDPG